MKFEKRENDNVTITLDSHELTDVLSALQVIAQQYSKLDSYMLNMSQDRVRELRESLSAVLSETISQK